MGDDVTRYIEKLNDWRAELAESLRTMVHNTIPEVTEKIEYGKPHFSKNGKHAAVIHAGKDRISFMIFNAADLAEIKGFFKSLATPDRKAATFKQGDAVDLEVLASLLKQASETL